ncbi:hypothetical protein Poli38472_008060 [Pythium oligandrum]|uniref:Anoctamin transmembrane domain-containing protein n=1 Tax=Pythium oligandrum TaxID=41045 RepID=A0A8K1CM32_PYTOL|nr:hypothetical protein Poli38472_008060 [Pythium oligandrum]|eukprot:TMW65418.1 hypothetical protein Poli38472_008060 [Pythium oligandrum]
MNGTTSSYAPSRVRPFAARDEEDDDEVVDGFSGMRSSVNNWETIEREVEELLNPSEESRSRYSVDQDVEVGAFLSHQPQYQQSIVAKKLLLYEKQLIHRQKAIDKLERLQEHAQTTIQGLRRQLEQQEKDFEDERAEWEQEKTDMLRFRGAGGSGGGGGAAMQLQLRMGASAAALAARRRLTEADQLKQQQMRTQMLHGAAEAQAMLLDDAVDISFTNGPRRRTPWNYFRLWLMRRMSPLEKDVKQIEARFGTSVASYFRFFLWIISSFGAISIPALIFLILHILVLNEVAKVQAVEWTAFAGIAPKVFLLSGYVSFEALGYTVVLVSIMALLLLFTIRKWIAEDRLAKTVEAMENDRDEPKFSKVVLNAWDCSLTSHEQASDMKRAITEQIRLTVEEEKVALTLRTRTRKERHVLYLRRAVAFIVYLVFQVASWYVILLLTTQSSEIQEWIGKKAAFLASYASSIVPGVVTIINSVLPTILAILTKLEKWDDVGFAVKAMVTRLYLAKVLNVLIQLASYALLLDPYFLTRRTSVIDIVTINGPVVRKNVMLAFKPTIYACRAEQVASGLLMLVVTDFLVSKVGALAFPMIQWLIQSVQIFVSGYSRIRRQDRSKVMPASDLTSADGEKTQEARPATGTTEVDASSKLELPSSQVAISERRPTITKYEFQVPQKMVALLYSCTIALLAIPLAPSTAILTLMLHIINFKFDKVFLLHLQKKPTSPWNAKDAGNFFIKFYFCTILIALAFTHFFLSSSRLPKACELQDTTLDASQGDAPLCAPKSYVNGTEQCVIDSSNPSSSYFTDSARECQEGYPKCICSGSRACGPFVKLRNGYSPLILSLVSVQFVSACYSLVLANPIITWGFVGLAILVGFFMRNSLRVSAIVAAAREHEMTVTFASLHSKIKQLETRLRLQTKFNSTTVAPQDPTSEESGWKQG